MNRAENRALNAAEYEQGCVVLRSRPQLLVLELTQGCNLACPMCRAEAITPATSRLARAHFDLVADQLFPTTQIVDLRGWGESLILPDIIDYIDLTARAGCRVRFVSNLSFNRPAVLEALVTHQAMLTCSLDAADPEVLSSLRKGARLSTILTNLRFLSEHHGDPESLAVLCTVQSPALPTLPELPALLSSVGIKHLHFAAVSSRDPAIGLDYSSPFAQEQVRQTLSACAEHLITVTLTTSLPGAAVSPMPRCMRPWTTLHVNVDGRVGYCDHLIGPFAESQLLGTVGEGLLNVWNSEAWQGIRRRHNLKAPQFKKCVKCYREKGADFEAAWLGKEWR